MLECGGGICLEREEMNEKAKTSYRDGYDIANSYLHESGSPKSTGRSI